MKVIGQIYEEYDYGKFKRLPDNRDVLERRFKKLTASISEKYILCPIIVNEKMEIIDGQGRFEVLKHLNKPIHYIISPQATSDDCRRMNKYNTNWSRLDFAKSHAKAGKKSYQLLLRICEETGLSISTVLRLANHASNARKNQMTRFEIGSVEFDEYDFLKVKNIKEKADEIIGELQYTKKLSNTLYASIKIVIETDGYDHERMLRNCRINRSSFVSTANLADQLVEFERIYNYKARASNRIYFSDYMRNITINRDYSKTYTEYKDRDVSTLK